MLLIADLNRDQNLSAPSQAIVVCPVSIVQGKGSCVPASGVFLHQSQHSSSPGK